MKYRKICFGCQNGLMVSCVLVSLAIVAAGTLPYMERQLTLDVAGAAAAFYTYQQPLPTGIAPYAFQDEWVQHVYTNGAAAVYTVALISPHPGQHVPDCSLLPGQPQQCSRAWARAVQPGSLSQLTAWFEQYLKQQPGPLSADTNSEHSGDMLSTCEDKSHIASAPTTLHDRTLDRGNLLRSSPGPSDAEGGYCEAAVCSAGLQHAVGDRRHRVTLPSSGGGMMRLRQQQQQHPASVCRHRNFQLFLGLSIPLTAGGGVVSKQQLDEFLASEVSTRVQGFTLISGTGFWQGEQEATAVLEVVSDAVDVADVVLEIANAYRAAFQQEAVMMKEAACPALVEFV